MFKSMSISTVFLMICGFVLSIFVFATSEHVGAQETSEEELQASSLSAIGAAFNYQGNLNDGSVPAKGIYDFQFRLFNTGDTVGTQIQIGETLTFTDVNVLNGIFSVALNFGENALKGDTGYIEVAVSPAGQNNYTVLAPRQRLRAVPYAYKANYANGLAPVGGNPNVTVRGNGLTIQGSACCGDIILKSGDTNTSGIIQAYRDGVLIWTQNKSVLGLGTNNQTHLRITENGRVGIGTLDPQVKLDVNGWVRAKKFETVAGSDLAEPFSVVTNEHIIEPGMVVAIDPTHAGQLRIADTAYDKTVAGILSGANGVNSGIIMQQEELTSDGDRLVALTGRVYVWADAQYGAIEPGDLLTTSATPGHAMKVNDHARAQGAILGKAMTALDEGTGFVLVLVSLQ